MTDYTLQFFWKELGRIQPGTAKCLSHVAKYITFIGTSSQPPRMAACNYNSSISMQNESMLPKVWWIIGNVLMLPVQYFFLQMMFAVGTLRPQHLYLERLTNVGSMSRYIPWISKTVSLAKEEKGRNGLIHWTNSISSEWFIDRFSSVLCLYRYASTVLYLLACYIEVCHMREGQLRVSKL